jgi:flagellar biosynthesis protein FlhA
VLRDYIDLRQIRTVNFGSAILIITMLGMIIIPLPPFLLDLLFSFNITLSLIVLMACVYVVRPLEFSLFPTILLITTLLRLTLNIASTRVVLLHGHQGLDAAGEVIRAFGEVVIGGNFVVGMIIFIILMIINFIVITKGAGRISEVTARFTLDALPGKQMAIDADINAGLITQEEAKKRREEIMQESEFYGSMDGASKFVRGDAVAGLLILIINLFGGILIGVLQNGMTINAAAENFSLLTIGDGLVAQIPSLLLSISAAIMVTRVSNEQDMSQQTYTQLLRNPKPLVVSAVILFVLALIPKMPHMPLILFSFASLITTSYFQRNAKKMNDTQDKADAPKVKTALDGANEEEVDWDDVVTVDRIGLELGYGLINLVGVKKDGQLMSRLKGVRKKISQDLGFLIPAIHVKDNVSMPPNSYKIYLKGVTLVQTEVYPDKFLAINPGHITTTINGIACKDPTFGLDAYWVTAQQKDYAQSLGFTLVDVSTVIATNVNQVIRTNAAHILSYEEVQQLINRLTSIDPKLVEMLTSSANGLPLNIIFTVLQRLLQSGVPLIDFRTIAEKMVELWSKAKDLELLIDGVRVALKHLIVYSLSGGNKEFQVAVLDPELAEVLHKSIQSNQASNEKFIVLEPVLTENILSKLFQYVKLCDEESIAPVLVVSQELRLLIERLFKGNIPNMHFLSFNEIPEDKHIRIMMKIS